MKKLLAALLAAIVLFTACAAANEDPPWYGRDFWIGSYSDGCARYFENGKWGIVDSSGSTLVKPRFEYLSYSGGPYATFMQAGKWGVIDLEGRQLAAPEYDLIQCVGDGNMLACREGVWQTVEISTGRAAPLGCDCVYYLQQCGVCCFEKDGKFGLVDTSGRVILDAVSDEAIYFGSFQIADICTEGTYALVHASGRMLTPFLYDGVDLVQNGLQPWVWRDGQRWAVLFGADGNELVPLSEGLKLIWNCGGTDYLYAYQRDDWTWTKCWLADWSTGEPITPKYDLLTPLDNGAGYIAMQDGQAGFFQMDGTPVIPHSYDRLREECMDVRLDRFLIAERDGKVGTVGLDGEVRLPVACDQIRPVNLPGSLLEARIGDKWGLLGEEGRLVWPISYDIVAHSQSGNGLVSLCQNDKWALANLSGQLLTGFDYDCIIDIETKAAVACKDGKWGLVGADGSELIPFAYETADVFEEGLAVFRQGDAFACFDDTGIERASFTGEDCLVRGGFITVRQPGGAVTHAANPLLKESGRAAVLVDSSPLYADDAWRPKLAVLESGTACVPVRALCDRLGIAVGWDADTGSVVCKNGRFSAAFRLDSRSAVINGREMPAAVPAHLIDSTTYVPLRMLAEAFGWRVEWDGTSNTVHIERQ